MGDSVEFEDINLAEEDNLDSDVYVSQVQFPEEQNIGNLMEEQNYENHPYSVEEVNSIVKKIVSDLVMKKAIFEKQDSNFIPDKTENGPDVISKAYQTAENEDRH